MLLFSSGLKIKEKSPSFGARNQYGDLVRLEDFQSNWLILYFYQNTTIVKREVKGKEYMGVVRSTFLIAPDGTLSHAGSKVRAKRHIEKVLTKLQ